MGVAAYTFFHREICTPAFVRFTYRNGCIHSHPKSFILSNDLKTMRTLKAIEEHAI